jgi:hypothetical protein
MFLPQGFESNLRCSADREDGSAYSDIGSYLVEEKKTLKFGYRAYE